MGEKFSADVYKPGYKPSYRNVEQVWREDRASQNVELEIFMGLLGRVTWCATE